MRSIICISIAVASLTSAMLLSGCQSCSSERARSPDQGGEDAAETRRLGTVQIEADPLRRHTTIDLPAPRLHSFELLDAGKEPRQVLRYTPGIGRRVLAVTLRVESREHTGDGWSPAGALPELRYGLALERTSAEDLLSVRGTAIEVGEPAEEEPAVRAYATRAAEQLAQRYREQIEGRRATLDVNDRGLMRELVPVAGATPAPGPHTRQEMLQILAESIVPLPEEAVGAGARWRVTMLMRRGQALVNQVGTYELRSIDNSAGGPSWRIRAMLAQDGEHQVVSAAGLPAGMTAELLALAWRAEGNLVVSPTSVAPISGELAVEYRVHSRLNGPQQRDSYLESEGEVTLATRSP